MQKEIDKCLEEKEKSLQKHKEEKDIDKLWAVLSGAVEKESCDTWT